ncbi:MAG: glycosyltransferase family 2 protein [Phycisphaeraceae bacterium]
MRARLYVAILNYDQPQLTLDCLRTAVPDAQQVEGGCRIGVCDNGSEGDSVQILRDAIESEGWGEVVELSAVHPNRGFTGGNNVLLRPVMEGADPPDYVLLLNNDTLVRPGAMQALVSFMDAHPKVGIGGSRLEDPDGTPQVGAFRFYSALAAIEEGMRCGPVTRALSSWATVPEQRDEPGEVDWVPGASMIIRRAVVEAVGLLDEAFYTYYDDIDYCWNARRAGWPTWYVPESRVVHLGGMTTGVNEAGKQAKRRPSYWFDARRRFLTKNYGPVRALWIDFCYGTAMLAGDAVAAARGRGAGRPERFVRDFWRYSTWARGTRPEPVKNPAMG